jgi:hypothetical protein
MRAPSCLFCRRALPRGSPPVAAVRGPRHERWVERWGAVERVRRMAVVWWIFLRRRASGRSVAMHAAGGRRAATARGGVTACASARSPAFYARAVLPRPIASCIVVLVVCVVCHTCAISDSCALPPAALVAAASPLTPNRAHAGTHTRWAYASTASECAPGDSKLPLRGPQEVSEPRPRQASRCHVSVAAIFRHGRGGPYPAHQRHAQPA